MNGYITGDHTDYSDADRDEAYAATHPSCLICGKGCCGSSVCACGPTPIALDAKALDVACSAECVSEYEAEAAPVISGGAGESVETPVVTEKVAHGF